MQDTIFVGLDVHKATISVAIAGGERWRWPLALALAVLVPLLAIEVSFFGANLLKFFHGGYVPVLLALALALAMATWVRGTSFVYKKARAPAAPRCQLSSRC